ncbi:MAG: cupin domain-containing protein [Myxococcota bacterium]
MRIRADCTQAAVVRPGDVGFLPSPMPGVERIMLDRVDGEVARATSLVRYAPERRFAKHVQGGGEECRILGGVFSDETGDPPTGTSVRNPIGSRHAPSSDGGRTTLVKLHAFSPDNRRAVVVDTRRPAFMPARWPGSASLALHVFGTERTEPVRLAPGAREPLHGHDGGEACLVLDGELADDEERHPAGTGSRRPVGSPHATFRAQGCLRWRKTGHLVGRPDGSGHRADRTRTSAADA